MNLLFPLGLAALAALVPLIVLYLLKQRREEHPIPAAFLWQNALEDLRASSLFQRLRTPLLLLLQALAVLLFALAAAGASLDLDIGHEPRRVLVLVDRSRSMMATDEDDSSRFEIAVEMAQNAIDGLRSGDEMMLVAFDEGAEVLVAFSSDESVLETALDAITPRDLGSRPSEALRIAASYVQASPGFLPEVVVLSDGAVQGELPNVPCQVTFARLGKLRENQGIAEAKLTQLPGEPPQLFVRVENGGIADSDRMLVLRRDGAVVDARQLTIPFGGEDTAFFELTEPEGDEPKLLRISLDGEDVLEADDSVDLILRPTVPRFGLLVRDAPARHLSTRMLERLHRGLAVVEVSAADAVTTLAGDDPVDLIIYDGVAPETPPNVRAQIYIDCLPPESGLTTSGNHEYPIVIDWDRTHPITARCTFDNVYASEAMTLAGHERSHILLETTGGPLVLLTPIPGHEVMVIACNPDNSRWPLDLSWPLMLAQSLDVLLAGAERDGEQPLSPTGTPLRVPAAESATITRPDGETADTKPARDGVATYADTYFAGIYTVEPDGDAPDDVRAFALLDSHEIDITPAEELVLGGDPVAASPTRLRRNLLLRDPLLLLALGILILEWAIWCGRR